MGLRYEYREGSSPVSTSKRHFPQRKQHDKDFEAKSLLSVRHRKKASVAGASRVRGRDKIVLKRQSVVGHEADGLCLEEKIRNPRESVHSVKNKSKLSRTLHHEILLT